MHVSSAVNPTITALMGAGRQCLALGLAEYMLCMVSSWRVRQSISYCTQSGQLWGVGQDERYGFDIGAAAWFKTSGA